MAYEWSGYVVPQNGGFFVDIRASKRIFCMASSKEIDEKLLEHLTRWQPSKELDD
jgi:hypothetical protein